MPCEHLIVKSFHLFFKNGKSICFMIYSCIEQHLGWTNNSLFNIFMCVGPYMYESYTKDNTINDCSSITAASARQFQNLLHILHWM